MSMVRSVLYLSACLDSGYRVCERAVYLTSSVE